MNTNTLLVENKELLDEVLEGLRKPQKSLPSKLFYDERGSQLFDQICELDEYYLTRTEMQIMNDNIDEIVKYLGINCVLVELGSGSSIKTRSLIDHLPVLAAYIPIDISETHLIQSVEHLKSDYPNINIIPLVADYTRFLNLPGINQNHTCIDAYYPGSTIGNFKPDEARTFLNRIAKICGKGSGLLIGVDLQKDAAVLNAAYNDSLGITAEFNLNILNNINNMFDANFNLSEFKHKAFYNSDIGRIETRLISQKEQQVEIYEDKFLFDKNEPILTEYSYKYTMEGLSVLLKDIYKVEKVWTDKRKYFSIQFLRAV